MGWKRLWVAAVVAGLVLSMGALPAAAQLDDQTVEITLLHDSHFHGKYGDDEVPREACPGGAPPPGFEDVPPDNVHHDTIACATLLGIVRGTSEEPPLFSPATAATRGQIAALIARMLDHAGVELPEDPEQPFDDVEGSVHADDIARLAEAGVLEGRDGSFFPDLAVRRDQMASILIRALEFATDSTITPAGGPHFDDVEGGAHGANVDAAFELGLMAGRAERVFDPVSSTRRDQVASVVVRLLDHLALRAASGLTNIARYMALVQERKDALGDNALFLGNGDDIAPSLESGVFEPNGIHMIDALNVSPIDVNTFGNHEFDFGPDNLRALLEVSETTWVTANVRDIDTGVVFGADLGVEEFTTVDIGDVTVGITGLAPENMAEITSLGEDTEQIPADEALDMVVPNMREAGADLIVVASHLRGVDAIELADTRDDVDVFVGDHSAEVRDEPYVSDTGTIVSLAGHEFDFLAELTLDVTPDGEIVDFTFTLHDLAADFPLMEPLPAVQAVVNDYNAQLDEELNVVIGERTVTWDTRVGEVRTSENAFGNYLTDEMRAFHDADVAVQNSGGIRADAVFEPGDITRREIAEILPFANHVVLAEIEGEWLLAALERSVSDYPAPFGGFLQVSGIDMEFDPAREPGDRVVSVLIGGVEFDPNQTYTMATNDFTLGGGDGYEEFAEHTTVLVGADEAPLLGPFLMGRIEARDTPVDTDIEGRITVVEE